MNSRKCEQCGKEFSRWDRSDKKFCDAACRKAYSRRGHAAKRALDHIMSDLQTIRLTIKKHPDQQKKINEQLKRLRDEITDILRLSDKETIIDQAQKWDLIAGAAKRDVPERHG